MYPAFLRAYITLNGVFCKLQKKQVLGKLSYRRDVFRLHAMQKLYTSIHGCNICEYAI